MVQRHKAGILEDIERHLMQRSVQFADLRVTDVMIPRVDIVALDIALPEDTLLDRVDAHYSYARASVRKNLGQYDWHSAPARRVQTRAAAEGRMEPSSFSPSSSIHS
jgi:hypothetical protein